MAGLSTRNRMILSAITLLSERGVHGLTIDAVLAHSGAPRGSVYHHFPGGRQQLLVEAAQTAAGYISALVTGAAEGGDPIAAVDSFVAYWRQILLDSDFRSGCPVAALVGGADVPPEVAEVAATAFRSWSRDIATAFSVAGLGPADASSMAELTIGSIEGAVTLCRAFRSPAPIDRAAAQLRQIFEARMSAGSL